MNSISSCSAQGISWGAGADSAVAIAAVSECVCVAVMCRLLRLWVLDYRETIDSDLPLKALSLFFKVIDVVSQ